MNQEEKNKKAKKALIIFLVFFIFMIGYIAITPFLVMENVKHKTSLPAKERMK
jgi:flagellar basal body-associated protein FliL